MSRKQLSVSKSLVLAAALGLTASSAAFADDSSMSMWTGDSYAYFNNLDYSAGRFNTARAPRTEERNAVADSPMIEREGLGQRVNMTRPSFFARPSPAIRPPLVTRPSTTTRTNPFRDDTGQ